MRQRTPKFDQDANHRRLRVEPLEDRRMLAVITVNTEQDVFDHTDSLTSLREAIFAANIVPGPDEIVFEFGHPGPATILLEHGELPITDDLTITGPGADLLTIDASGNDQTPDQNNGDGSRIFNIVDGEISHRANVHLARLTLTGGDARGNGGAVYSKEQSGIGAYGTVVLRDIVIAFNSATSQGGGVYLYSGKLEIANSSITGNWADNEGGGIWNGGTATLTNSTLSNNYGSNGGGIFNDISGTVTIADSTLSGNLAYDGGGAFNLGSANITSSTLSGNSAFYGGAIDNFGTVMITGSTLSGNRAITLGGGIFNPGIATITRSSLSENHAGDNGGGIENRGTLTITGSILSRNLAAFAGGGILNRATTTINGSTLSDNLAEVNEGGGIFNENRGTVMVTGSTFSGNTAHAEGGGLANHGTATIIRSTLSGNSAYNGSGGGIDNAYRATVAITGSTLSGNSAYFSGGGLSNLGTATITSSIIANSVSGGDVRGTLIGGSNLIESGSGGLSDTITLDPLLGPLADNGGPTQTHALLPGSPALDAGDPSIVFDPNQFDQRGDPFTRVAVGVLTGVPPTPRIDIGSYEAQAPPSADFNNDLHVDGRDFLSWQRASGQSGAAAASGDSDHDGDADTSDLAAWQVSYGDTIILPPIAATIEAGKEEPASRASALDGVLSITMFETAGEDEDFLLDEPTGAEVAHDAVFTRGEYRPADVRRFSTPKLDIPGVRNEEEESAEPSTAVLLARAFED